MAAHIADYFDKKSKSVALKLLQSHTLQHRDLHVSTSNAKGSVVIPGVRWLNSLTVTGHGFVSLPDLELVIGGVSWDSHCELYTPKLVEVGEEAIVDNDEDFNGFEDFEILTTKKWTHNDNMMISGEHVRSYFDDGDGQNLAIANDEEYGLFRTDKGHYLAGCHNFKSVDEAIAHWMSVLDCCADDDEDLSIDFNGSYSPRERRAMMFAFALTFFRDIK